MLALTRKPGESIVCEIQPSDQVTRIEVFIVHMEPAQVRIAIDADKKQVNIRRTEIKPLLPVVEKPTTSIGHISPNGLVSAIRDAIVVDDDGEPLPRFMTPMQKVDYYSRGLDSKPKNHTFED
jgi:sRNA-binding carbon storage regulator CsrA